jgi:hypothetical protein
MVSALEIIAHTYAFRITPEMIEAFGPVLRGVTLVTSESRLPCWTEIAENIYGEHVADYSSLLWGFIARHYSMPQLGPLQCYSTDEDLGDKEDVSSVDIEHTVVHDNEDPISSSSDHDEFAATVAKHPETFKVPVEVEL